VLQTVRDPPGRLPNLAILLSHRVHSRDFSSSTIHKRKAHRDTGGHQFQSTMPCRDNFHCLTIACDIQQNWTVISSRLASRLPPLPLGGPWPDSIKTPQGATSAHLVSAASQFHRISLPSPLLPTFPSRSCRHIRTFFPFNRRPPAGTRSTAHSSRRC
jgi:hypothetical protein